MRRALFLLLGILVLAFAGLLARVATGAAGAGPVYSVAALQTHLAQEPTAWVRRTVWVRAIAYADGCATWGTGDLPTDLPTCLEWQALLFDRGAAASAHPLALARGSAPSLLAFLRRVPVLRWWAPTPQVVQWNDVATYRIQVRAVSCRPHHALPCTYEALLLDAAPFTA